MTIPSRIHPHTTGAFLGSLLLFALSGCAGSAEPKGPPTVGAACAAPVLTVEPETVSAGGTVTLSGEGWQPCHDTPNDPPPASAESGAAVWVQARSEKELGPIEFSGGAFQATLTVPATARGGCATIRVTAPGLGAEITIAIAD